MTAHDAAGGLPPGSGMPVPPDHDGRHLRHLLPSVLAALGGEAASCVGDTPGVRHGNTLGVPPASIAVVLMVDGLGDAQLARHSGHARFLAEAWRARERASVLDTGMPTTTAASLASLGTGLSAGQHGLVGYDVVDPALDRVVNMLGRWDPEVDPSRWQPHPVLLAQAARTGARVLTASRPQFEHSPLTRAALAGGDFLGATTMGARFRQALDWIRAGRTRKGQQRSGPPAPTLVYLYVDELDKTGHSHGVASDRWLHMLETLDAEAAAFGRELRAAFGDQATMLMTADHGMIDVAAQHRHNVAERPELLREVRHTAGEPRLLQLHLPRDASGTPLPEPLEATRRVWEEAYGDVAWVVSAEEAIRAGWFGTVSPAVRPRIGDLLIAAREEIAFFDTSRTGRKPLEMIGQHGSLTDAERHVPLLELSGRAFV